MCPLAVQRIEVQYTLVSINRHVFPLTEPLYSSYLNFPLPTIYFSFQNLRIDKGHKVRKNFIIITILLFPL